MPATSEASPTPTPRLDQLAWHAAPPEEVARKLETDIRLGITKSTAERRLEEHGANELPEAKGKSLWRVFWSQFANPLIYILLAAAGIAFGMGHGGDAVVILIVLLVNAAIGTFQEGRAEHSMHELRRLSSLRARVIREGREEIVEARDLVPGDVMLLAAGDAVGADARLVEAAALEAAEAALTGESLPVSKEVRSLPVETALADRRNLVFSGTQITAGRGRAIVISTGLGTEVGKIATMTTGASEPKTPLELRLGQFTHRLAIAAGVLFVIVLAVGMWRGLPFGEVFMVAISQMVSMVPEGLPVALTIALAVGMQRMARRGAIVRRLTAVETLGSTSIICSDKTGTLTKNEMTVTALLLPDGTRLEASGIGYAPEGKVSADGREIRANESADLRSLLEAVVLCNDSQIVPPQADESRWRPLGDPTEAALLTVAVKAGVEIEELRRGRARRAEIPFDSGTKLMATEHGPDDPGHVLVKGAAEVLLDLCRGDGIDRAAIAAASVAFANQGLRVLGVAELTGHRLDEKGGFEPLRGRVRFLGLLGQLDPAREEAKSAVAECRSAGVRPVMVTGDHKLTGLAIAQTLGIARDGDIAVDGTELERMSREELVAALDRISVFARVHPAQKLRIVEAFQSQRQVVAMTGDGVNDAPALASADVGVAMGITGTEVAKGAAKIVITDDNFATIVKAVEEGRLVYQNLKKVVLFLFATSLDEVIVLMLALVLGYPLPLAAVQILWINVVTEGTVTVNLIMEGLEGNEMRRKPTPVGEALLGGGMLERLALMVTCSVISIFGYFIWKLSTGAPFALVQTETFTLVAICQWFNVLNCRSALQSSFTGRILTNPWIVGGLSLSIILQALVVYWEPMNRAFYTVPIPLGDVGLLFLVGSLVLWAEEIRKWFARREARNALPDRA